MFDSVFLILPSLREQSMTAATAECKAPGDAPTSVTGIVWLTLYLATVAVVACIVLYVCWPRCEAPATEPPRDLSHGQGLDADVDGFLVAHPATSRRGREQ